MPRNRTRCDICEVRAAVEKTQTGAGPLAVSPRSLRPGLRNITPPIGGVARSSHRHAATASAAASA
jgi:hypothetical protein